MACLFSSFSHRGAILLALVSGLMLSTCSWFPGTSLLWWVTGMWSLAAGMPVVQLGCKHVHLNGDDQGSRVLL